MGTGTVAAETFDDLASARDTHKLSAQVARAALERLYVMVTQSENEIAIRAAAELSSLLREIRESRL